MSKCIIIPNYNHGSFILSLIKGLEKYNLACVIIDDGSNLETKKILKEVELLYSWVKLITLINNKGKGRAVKEGIKYAYKKGYTHAIQIDADGQHDLQDLSKFISASDQYPEKLISGQPIYDSSIPKGRKYGRKITDFWVMIETLSLDIKESMCGFRVYPLRSIMRIIQIYSLGDKMDFDIEICVKAYWEGVKLRYIPTKVSYPDNGVSHFNIWRDNVLISWMHTKLLFGMVAKSPRLIKYKVQRKNKSYKAKHWSEINERGSKVAMRLMLVIYKVLGKKTVYYMLYPIALYFYFFGRKARKASEQYLKQLELSSASYNKSKWQIFKHFLSFSESVIDKLAVWRGDIEKKDISFPNLSLLKENIKNKEGGVIFSAHLGNLEIARALSRFEHDVKINAISFNQHAKKFNNLLQSVNPSCKLNIIEIQDLNIQVAIDLKDRVDRGEFIVIMCDRTSPSRPERTIDVSFLGKKAYLPEGAFILGGMLKTKAYFMLCLKENRDQYSIIFNKFSDKMNIERKNRDESLAYYAQKFSFLIEEQCKNYPLQWFNFFNFWENKEGLSNYNNREKNEEK